MEASKQHAVVASTGLQVDIHPLVVMNISDQYTRAKVERNGRETSIVGALFGRNSGRSVEVCNSFDLKVDQVDGMPFVDVEFLELRDGQYKQVFKNLEIVGWYCVGSTPPSQREASLLSQLSKYNENPILLKFNSMARESKQAMLVYESVVDLEDGGPTIQFRAIGSNIAAEEAERICVDHVARLQDRADNGDSKAIGPLSTQRSAVRMLQERVLLLLEYVKEVQAGNLEADKDILRSISSLCNLLPVMNSAPLIDTSREQSHDVMLTTYLATLTKSFSAMSETVRKFRQAEERPAIGRKTRAGMCNVVGDSNV